MKTNNNQALLYDDNCPLCAAYTKAFIKTGLLHKENRIAFSTINITDYQLDTNRARHEIPLINTTTGEVKYGVDALADILNQKIPFVKFLLRIKIIYWFFKKLYSFISYNRKIIVASPAFAKTCFDCSPDYSYKHRVAMAVFTWILSGFISMQAADSAFLSVSCIWFFTTLILASLLSINKTKHQSADILVHSGITMLLSVIISRISAKIFLWLFTFSWPLIICLLLPAATIFTQQLIRRYRFYQKEYAA